MKAKTESPLKGILDGITEEQLNALAAEVIKRLPVLGHRCPGCTSMASFPVISIDSEAEAVVDKMLAQKRTTAFTKIKTGCPHPRSEEGMNSLGQFFCGTCGEVFK